MKDVVENEVLDEKEYQKVKKIFNKSSDYFTKKEIEEIFEGKTTSIEEFFKNLKEEVEEYYKA